MNWAADDNLRRTVINLGKPFNFLEMWPCNNWRSHDSSYNSDIYFFQVYIALKMYCIATTMKVIFSVAVQARLTLLNSLHDPVGVQWKHTVERMCFRSHSTITFQTSRIKNRFWAGMKPKHKPINFHLSYCETGQWSTFPSKHTWFQLSPRTAWLKKPEQKQPMPCGSDSHLHGDNQIYWLEKTSSVFNEIFSSPLSWLRNCGLKVGLYRLILPL